MTVANQDFEIDEGATRTLLVPLTVDGAPYVVPGGATINWWASPSQFDDAAAVPLKKSTTSGIVVSTVGSQSSLQITLSTSDTVGRGQKKLFHQARITRADGVVVPLFSGTMTVNKRLVV
jgi:hypothetical protein